MTTWVVTGRHRTGTSMMMQAISQCIPTVFDMQHEIFIRSRELDPLYNPNPNGYWNTKTLPHDHPEALVKCSIMNWPFVNPGNYKIIWMQRNEYERKLSMNRSFGSDSNMERFYIMGESILLNLNTIQLNYSDVVNKPLQTFEMLQQNGWPIDPKICSSVIDPNLWRNKQ